MRVYSGETHVKDTLNLSEKRAHEIRYVTYAERSSRVVVVLVPDRRVKIYMSCVVCVDYAAVKPRQAVISLLRRSCFEYPAIVRSTRRPD